MRYPLRLQAFGWTLVIAIDFAINQAQMPPAHTVWALYEAITLGLAGLAVSSLLWWLARRFLPAAGPRMYLGASLAAVAGSAAWYAAITALDRALGYQYYDPPLAYGLGGLLAGWMLYLFTMAAWCGALVAQRALGRAAEAERLAREARLSALRYQLNPHFLFNSLNSVIAMIDEDPRRAQTMLEQLSALLRHTLAGDAAGAGAGALTTLGDELDLIDRYLAIERVRFEEKLRIDVDVSEAARACTLPPLLLHALVENAIKHGMRTSPMPLELRLAARVDGDTLLLEVVNSGRLAAGANVTAAGAGVGLRNVAARLDALYPGRHRFAVGEQGGSVRASLAIPAPAPRLA